MKKNRQGVEESTEFQRFRELTRLLIQVPKSEIADKLKPRMRKRNKRKKQKHN